jgi:hypothetical protein
MDPRLKIKKAKFIGRYGSEKFGISFEICGISRTDGASPVVYPYPAWVLG